MAYDIDPDQSVSIVAIFLFIDAAFLGFPVLSTMLNGGAFPVVALVLIAALIAVGAALGLVPGHGRGRSHGPARPAPGQPARAADRRADHLPADPARDQGQVRGSMIVGIGIDAVEVARIRRALDRHP